MIGIALFLKVYEGLNRFYEDIQLSQIEKQKEHHVLKAIKCLHNNGGHLVDVSALRGSTFGIADSEIHASIHFKVVARQGIFTEQRVSQNVTHCIDLRTWRAIQKDLDALKDKFLDAATRSYKKEDIGGHDFLKGFSQYTAFVSDMAKREIL